MKLYFEEFIEAETPYRLSVLVNEFLKLTPSELKELGVNRNCRKDIDKFISNVNPDQWLGSLFKWDNNSVNEDFNFWNNVSFKWRKKMLVYNKNEVIFFKRKFLDLPNILFEGG